MKRPVYTRCYETGYRQGQGPAFDCDYRVLLALSAVQESNLTEEKRMNHEEGELTPEGTIRKFRMVQSEGFRQVSREVDFYNLDVISSTFTLILLGFRLLIGSRNGKVVDRGVGKS